MQQASFGKKPHGDILEHIKASGQYAENAFINQEATPQLSHDASYWKMILRMFEKNPGRAPTDTLPVEKTDYTINESGETRFTWFGHSGILIQTLGKNILIDPVFSERASPVQYIGAKNFPGTEVFSIDQFPAIDFVFISHDHYDHLDYGSIQKLKARSSETKYYVPLGISSHLAYWGIDPSKITEMDWWEEQVLSDSLKLIATPARHFSGRALFDRNKTLWTSYVLLSKNEKIYFSGDSGYGKHFKQIGEVYGPFDIAFLECGQYNSWWPYIHMMPEEVVQAAIDLQTKRLVPIHWGKFTLGFHTWKEPVERLQKRAAEEDVNMLYPIIGQGFGLHSSSENVWWEKLN